MMARQSRLVWHLRPILKQEPDELGLFWGNPVVSRKERLNKLEQIVCAFDEKIRPVLSQAQQEKLLQMHKEERQQVKKLLVEKPNK